MTTDVIADPASLERQRLLLGAFEAWAGEASLQEQAEREHGHHEHAACRGALRRSAEAYATLIRDRLVVASALTEDDVDTAPDAPPPDIADILAKLPDEKLAAVAPPVTAAGWHLALHPTPPPEAAPEPCWCIWEAVGAVAGWIGRLCRRVLVVHAWMTAGWWRP